MSTKKFFTIFMIIFMLFSVSGCGGSGGHTQNITNNPVSHDNPVPIPEPPSDDITIIPEPSPLSQDKPVSQEPIPTPIISHDPVPTPILYTVTFNSNGGSAVSSITVSSGNTVTKPNDPSKYGYTFDGWYKDSALTQVFRFGSNGDKVTGNITLYAKWFETDRLRAEIAIGKISIGYQDGDNANSVTKNLTLPTLVNASGDVNVSWSSNAPSVISNSGIVTRPSDNDVVVSLTAQITVGSEARNKTFTVTVLHEVTPAPSGYTVTFNSNGGSAVASIHTSSGGTVIMPENPVRKGYVFAGWYKDEAFTEIFTFGADGDKITKDITLYAKWFDEDLLIAEYSASKIAIGYANGDSSKHVTKNLKLPAKIDSADIIWGSSSGAVSSNGTVTRQDNDVEVALTATATYNGKSAETKTFNVKVIRKRTSTSTDIKVIDIQALVSEDLEIEYNESGDRVTDIDGHFSDISIKNADDALDAIYSVSGVLGIDNPYEELEVDGSNISKYTSVYSFAQVHNGVKIYGRYVTLGADKNNTASYLSSNLISSYLLDNVKPAMAKLTQSQAEQIISVDYSHVDVMETEQIIFSLYDYEIAPAYAWKIVISGTKSNGSYEDETVFINAENNTIIQRYTNIENAFLDKEINGFNELRKVVNFPLGFRFLKGYYMEDKDLKITMYTGDFSEENIIGPIDTSISYQDPHQISAYTNMREIMKWWKASFDRDSLDDNGMEVKVITHNRWGKDRNGDILKDNAAWYPISRVIVIGDNSDRTEFDRTAAAALDVLTHETGHAVMQFLIGHDLGETKLVNQDNVVASINLVALKEAYADIFSFLKDHDWTNGDNLFFEKSASGYSYGRNARDPSDGKALTHVPSAVLNATTADYEGHSASLIITHAAYLMHQDGLSKQDGLTWDELAQLWYQSLQPNAYTPTSTFLDVRKNVMRAARALNLPDNKVKNIEKAFREVGIYDDTPKLCLVSGLITDFETKLPISRATVSVMKETEYDFETIHETETNLIGMFLLTPTLKEGRYAVNVFADGYVNFRQEFTITDGAKFILNVPMIKDGKGSIKGYVCASNKNNPLEGVTVNIRRGWYEKGDTTGYIWASVVTKADGSFSFNLGENGADYYMLEMIKSESVQKSVF